MFVSRRGPDQPYSYARTPTIELHDIVVARELRGKRLGTAALIELCMYADLHGLPIEGMLEPDPGEPDETVATVSRWYASMGFTQGERKPRQWLRGGQHLPLSPQVAVTLQCRLCGRTGSLNHGADRAVALMLIRRR
ncbi:GNAT family N-acetyltransferase [Arthrobacter sp. GAS37]|uniref:GNAT family N-acetyltransferase n=1 Tax=Arthrobacter sp. GAS37 TaxID=3156261 RepID=UPI0038504C80